MTNDKLIPVWNLSELRAGDILELNPEIDVDVFAMHNKRFPLLIIEIGNETDSKFRYFKCLLADGSIWGKKTSLILRDPMSPDGQRPVWLRRLRSEEE